MKTKSIFTRRNQKYLFFKVICNMCTYKKRFYRLVGYHLFLNFTKNQKEVKRIFDLDYEEFQCGTQKILS